MPPMMNDPFDERRGGNLSHLIGIPSAARRYEALRPAGVEVSDEFGYRNIPPTRDVRYPIVVAGDSFMVYGYPITNTISARLSTLSGLPVYNHAWKGRGPFIPVIRFLQNERFAADPPQVLVWGLPEYEASGHFLADLVYQLARLEGDGAGVSRPAGIDWRQMGPQSVHDSLPNTSAVAQSARNMWNELRFHLFGRLNPELVVACKPVNGLPFLFYRLNIEALKRDAEGRYVEQAVWAIQQLDAACRRRGTLLVVLLIPDKERVYEAWLPEDDAIGGTSAIPPSVLWDLEQGLSGAGVHVVNALPVFERARDQDVMLYWPDDTHWTPEGIALAAEALWAEISALPREETREYESGDDQ